MRGQSVGQAGGSLAGDTTSWAKASSGAQKAGRDAEIKTAAALSLIVGTGPTVLHDLRIPIPGFSANIDHVVVHGSRVLIIDAKAWAPGFYWTLGGVTRRGWTRAEHCDRKTVPTAVSALQRYLLNLHVPARFDRPMLAVWQSHKASSFLMYKPQGAPHVVSGNRLPSWLRRHVKCEPADPAIVMALSELVL